MSDRWARAGERSRQRADEQQRRYRRGGAHRSTTDGWDDYEDDDTAVIPRYVDEDEPAAPHPDGGYGGAHHDLPPGYGPPERPVPRGGGRHAAEPDYGEPPYADAEYDDPQFAAPGYTEPG